MEEFEAAWENAADDAVIFEVHAEFEFEGWPFMADLDDLGKKRVCAAVSEALATVSCPVHGIKTIPDGLMMAVQMSPEISVDDVARVAFVAAQQVSTGTSDPAAQPPYTAWTIDPSDVIESVMRLR